MWTLEQKIKCVIWYIESKSLVTVQRKFRNWYRLRYVPSKISIKSWYEKFANDGSILHRKGAGRPAIAAEHVAAIEAAFRENQSLSIRKARPLLNMPYSRIQKTLRKTLRLFPYRLTVLQALKESDYGKRYAYALQIITFILQTVGFLKKVIFSDEATFSVSGKVNKQNVRIWGSEKPHAIREHERDSPKVHVWCALKHNRVIGPFFFSEKTVRSGPYLDMLQNFFLPQVQGQRNIIFQQDGAPPHWALAVRDWLDRKFPGRWIGRGGPIPWPPRSPDLTPLDFFLWGYIKDCVYKTPVIDLPGLKSRIVEAIGTVNTAMLSRTWREMERRLDLVFLRDGAHVEIG